MDDLRKDLRSEFERRQAGLGEIRGARETLVKQALADRSEPPSGRLQFAAGVAAILIAALVIATLAYVRGRSTPYQEPLPAASSGRVESPLASPVAFPTSKPPSIPPGMVIWDLDLVDLSTGWVLVTNCVQPIATCHYYVVITQNSGATWSKPVQVGGQFDPTNGDAPRTVHFLNRSDGFVYGGSIAYVTHDGGRSWARLNIPAVFIGFVTGRGSMAWAASYPCPKGTLCPYEVRSSADGGRTWSSPYKLPVGLSPGEAVPFGASGLLMATGSDLMMTLDGGATWREIKSACTSAVFQQEIATSDGHELWLLCSDFPAQGAQQKHSLYVSEDAGLSWSLRTIKQPGELKPGTNGVGGVESLTAGSVLFNPGVVGVVVSHDVGVSWTKAGPDVGFGTIRFCGASDGWALDTQNYIWATTDGGDNWRQVTGIQIQGP
jgi:photosystem II stability/assembly factor-like uncharacterized protein